MRPKHFRRAPETWGYIFVWTYFICFPILICQKSKREFYPTPMDASRQKLIVLGLGSAVTLSLSWQIIFLVFASGGRSSCNPMKLIFIQEPSVFYIQAHGNINVNRFNSGFWCLIVDVGTLKDSKFKVTCLIGGFET